jgi:hypothetical protein
VWQTAGERAGDKGNEQKAGGEFHVSGVEQLERIVECFVMNEFGKVMFVFGLVIAVIGLLLWTGVGKGWLGKLPGDINYSRDNFSFHFPIVTCLIVSVVLTLILWLIRK